MKWPLSLSFIRHGESGYNVLKKIKKDDNSDFSKFEKKFFEEYENAVDENWVSEELLELAHQARKELAYHEGDYDTPLTDEGWDQARRTGESLLEHMELPDIIYVSPYLRTRQTLEGLSETCSDLRTVKTVVEERIREQEHGLSTIYNDWRIYLTFNPSQAILHKRGTSYEYRYLNGENKADVRERVRSFLATLIRENSGEKVLVVTHHLTILSFRANLERWDREKFIETDKYEKPINCGLTTYKGHPREGRDGKLLLDEYNKKIY